jgi:hypothetical protein
MQEYLSTSRQMEHLKYEGTGSTNRASSNPPNILDLAATILINVRVFVFKMAEQEQVTNIRHLIKI